MSACTCDPEAVYMLGEAAQCDACRDPVTALRARAEAAEKERARLESDNEKLRDAVLWFVESVEHSEYCPLADLHRVNEDVEEGAVCDCVLKRLSDALEAGTPAMGESLLVDQVRTTRREMLGLHRTIENLSSQCVIAEYRLGAAEKERDDLRAEVEDARARAHDARRRVGLLARLLRDCLDFADEGWSQTEDWYRDRHMYLEERRAFATVLAELEPAPGFGPLTAAERAALTAGNFTPSSPRSSDALPEAFGEPETKPE